MCIFYIVINNSGNINNGQIINNTFVKFGDVDYERILNNKQVRHILNLETCISVIASYFYGLFIAEINNKKAKSSTKENFATHNSIDEIPLEKINNMRY